MEHRDERVSKASKLAMTLALSTRGSFKTIKPRQTGLMPPYSVLYGQSITTSSTWRHLKGYYKNMTVKQLTTKQRRMEV